MAMTSGSACDAQIKKQNKACLKNEHTAPNDLTKTAVPVYVFLLNLWILGSKEVNLSTYQLINCRIYSLLPHTKLVVAMFKYANTTADEHCAR